MYKGRLEDARGSSPSRVTRVLVFNFFGGVMDRGIQLYARDIAQCMRHMGLDVVKLRCPLWLRAAPRPLRNVLFVVFEQLVAPLVRAVRGCALTVYPYNSVGIIDTLLGRSVLVIHDLIGNQRQNGALAARYIRATQAVHRRLRRPICAASEHTLRQLKRIEAFRRCPLHLWTNPFYTFEEVISESGIQTREDGGPLRILLCSGIGANKDYGGALRLFASSKVLENAQLRVVGFGDDAHLARRRLAKLPPSVRERITVLPRLSLHELVAEYRASHLVWVHSRKEGFGRFVVEARLAGRPVLASNISAFRRLRHHGVHYYRKDSFDAAVKRALEAPPAPSPSTELYHEPLERAVREVLAAMRVEIRAPRSRPSRDTLPATAAAAIIEERNQA